MTLPFCSAAHCYQRAAFGPLCAGHSARATNEKSADARAEASALRRLELKAKAQAQAEAKLDERLTQERREQLALEHAPGLLELISRARGAE